MKAYPDYVHLNGEVVATSEARIHPFDRGLWYGDGLFETLRTYKGSIFALDEHLARMNRSAEFLELRLPRRSWKKSVIELLEANRIYGRDAWVRITITRGVSPRAMLPPKNHSAHCSHHLWPDLAYAGENTTAERG